MAEEVKPTGVKLQEAEATIAKLTAENVRLNRLCFILETQRNQALTSAANLFADAAPKEEAPT